MLENHLGYHYEGKTKCEFSKLKEDGYYDYNKIKNLKIPGTIHYTK
jgi:hypothetical protein